MSEKITLLLAKANWCGHCKKFEPIYDHSEEKYKNNKYLNKYEIKFEKYDLADDNEKNKFMLSHFKAMDKVKGYPTLFVNIRDGKKNDYHMISHTQEDQSIKGDEARRIDASEKFLENVSNLLKSLESDSKVSYVQTGGNMTLPQSTLEDEVYRKKYLKYKTKYLELKSKL